MSCSQEFDQTWCFFIVIIIRAIIALILTNATLILHNLSSSAHVLSTEQAFRFCKGRLSKTFRCTTLCLIEYGARFCKLRAVCLSTGRSSLSRSVTLCFLIQTCRCSQHQKNIRLTLHELVFLLSDGWLFRMVFLSQLVWVFILFPISSSF